MSMVCRRIWLPISKFRFGVGGALKLTTNHCYAANLTQINCSFVADPFSQASQAPFQDITAHWTSNQQFSTPSQVDFNTHAVARHASNSRSSKYQIDEQDGQGRTQLHQAVIQNSMEHVRALLSSGAHVGIRDNFNNEPLHLAVSQNEVNKEIVKMLLDYGACPHTPGEGRKSPLHLSVKAGPILKMLLKAGPNLSTADLRGNTALHDAALCDDSESPSCFVELLNYGADVNVLNAAGQTPFHLILDRAAQPEWSYIVSIALKHGADVLMSNERNQVPLQILAESLKSKLAIGWFEEIELFCSKGASLDVQLRSGTYLSHFLIQRVDFDRYWGLILGRLICQRAHPLIRGLNGNTVFHELMKSFHMKYPQLIEILLNRGADPNAEGDGGVTPFYLLFSHPYNLGNDILKATEMFVNAGANPIHSAPGGDILIYVAARNLRSDLRTSALKALLASIAEKYKTIELSQTLKGLHWWQNYIASLKQAESGDWAGADNRLQQGDDLRLPEDVDEDIRTSARIVLAENTLRHHKAAILADPNDQTYSEQEHEVFRGNVVSILRGCRANRIPIDLNFYQLLLDVIDFGE
jgi:ankyrin repeat protein